MFVFAIARDLQLSPVAAVQWHVLREIIHVDRDSWLFRARNSKFTLV